MFYYDEYYFSLGIKQVGDDYKVVNETNSVADVWFTGTEEECNIFLWTYSTVNACEADIMRKYVHNIRDYKVWMEM